MKRIPVTIIALALASSGMAQVKTRTVESDAKEAASRLNKARANGTAESTRRKDEAANEESLAKRAAAAAASELLREGDEKSKAVGESGQKSLDAAVKNVTAQGRELLSKGAKIGATKAPPKPEIVQEPLSEVKPQPLTPAPIEKPDDKGDKVVITSTGAAFFDADTAIALFTDNVEVHHPQFYIQSDEFEIHMIKEEEGAKTETATAKKVADPVKPKPAPQQGTALSFAAPGSVFSQPPTAPPPPAASDDTAPEGTTDSSIKEAIARGRKVMIEKLTETGDIQVGTCRYAKFVGKTGETIMRDMPQVQRGRNLQVATDPSTYMIIYQNGAMKTFGPSRTEILQNAQPKGGTHFKPQGQATPVAKPLPVQQ